jgi:UDP-2,4-diacetamido-2,4,6-trideoxy-beta-L-altropyranose hydrolase
MSHWTTIAIRVDASSQIGTGHVMRCLTIAEALRQYSVRVIFICRSLLGDWISILQDRGFETIALETDDESWNDDRDAHLTVEQLKDQQLFPDWMIIDHYQIGQDWQKTVRPAVKKIMVMDDLADRSHDCDLLLDQNLYPNYASRYANRVPRSCQCLLGPHYLILRDEFRSIACPAQKSLPSQETARKILLTFGGSDPFSLTERVLNSLSSQDQNIEVRVLLGTSFLRQDSLEELIKTLPFSVEILTRITEMTTQFQWADCAISAGGLTTYELAYVGLPALIIAVVDAQAEVAAEMAHLRIHQYAGHANELSETQLMAQVENFLNNFSRLKPQPKIQIDADGLDRVLTHILPENMIQKDSQPSEKWDIWNQSGGPKYPHEKIIQFIFRSIPKADRSSTRVLDLGCGSGVHTEFLAAEDFETYACDISSIGVQNTFDRLKKKDLTATVWQGGLAPIPIQEDYFDIVISCSVFEAAGLEVIQNSITEIIRVLKKGGKGFFLFASDQDFRVQGDNALKLHGFSDLEVEQIFKSQPLELLYIDRYITTFQNQTIQSNDFLVTIQK